MKAVLLAFLVLSLTVTTFPSVWGLASGLTASAAAMPSQPIEPLPQLPPLTLPNNDKALAGPQLNLPPVHDISIKLRNPKNQLTLQRLNNLFGSSLLRQNALTGVATLRAPKGVAPQYIVDQFMQHPAVEWAETVKWRRLSDPVTPTDPHYPISQKWYYDVIRAPDAWDMEQGNASTVIAILDSGVFCDHPDLTANIWVNTAEIPDNGIDDDGNGFEDDVNGYDFVGVETGQGDPETTPNRVGDSDPCLHPGDPSMGNGRNDDNTGQADEGVAHGTFVTGVAAAAANNGEGVAGMCWQCTIMPIRVANPEGWVRSDDTAGGITYAALNGAKVINLSLGGPEISLAERAAIARVITDFGVTIVGAAGNENQNPLFYPAQLSNVIAVGSSARRNIKGRASFSNWGTGSANNRTVDVVAPGDGLASTSVISVADQQGGHGAVGAPIYIGGSGTSFSAPLVSGLVGLMLSRNPDLTPAQVQQILKQTAVRLRDDPSDRPDAGPDWAGAGLIDAVAALNAVTPAPTPSPTGTVTPSPTESPTATPLPVGSAPELLLPASGSQLTGLGAALSWNLPQGATQYQIQVLPALNDGPAINLIRNAETSYLVEPPSFGRGPYVMLPGMTYIWRVRSTTAAIAIDEHNDLWGDWSAPFTFKTRTGFSTAIVPVAPAEGSQANSDTPILQWANSDDNVFYYEIQVSKDPEYGPNAFLYWELRHGGATTPLNSYLIPDNAPLEPGLVYYWRVRPRIQGDGVPVAWSPTFSFRSP